MLHGANRLARLVSVKGGPPPRLETKSTAGVVAPRRRAGGPAASTCSVCGRPAAAVVLGGLRRGESLICRRCVEEAGEGTDTSVLSADDVAAAYRLTDVELTSEEEYDAALDAEVRWDLEPDGTITRTTDDPTRGRAWGRSAGRAWGQP